MNEITNRITGVQRKFDQRDSMLTRASLGEEPDKKVRNWAKTPTPDPLYRTMMGIPRSENCLTYHLVSAVDGPVNPEKVPITNTAELTKKIKLIANFFGADRVGITKLNQAYVASHRADEYLVGSKAFGKAINLQHENTISLIFKRDYHLVKAGHSFIDGGEGTFIYNKVAVVACQLAAYIRELGYSAKAHHEREEEVLQVPLAVEAGMGELGRLGMLITPEFGPRVRISTVTTNLPLLLDKPINIGVQSFCELCKKCAQNCPSGAIPRGNKVNVRGVEKWVIEPRKCLGFWGVDKTKWDDCSMCITTCPYNRPENWFNKMHHKSIFFNALKRKSFAKLMLWIDDRIRGKRPRYKVRWMGYSNYE